LPAARVRPADDGVAAAAAVSWQHPSTRAVERERASALSAFFRARADRSAGGVRAACDRFAALGDRDVVTVCTRVANDLARRHPPQRREAP
jgi:hypothetical protein